MSLSLAISWRRDQSNGSKNFFGNISFDLWKDFGEDEDEEAVKEKVIDFLNPFHVAINKKEFFQLQVTNDQSSVTQIMKICLPSTCKLLGISRRMGQAVKAALLCKEEASANILSTVAEKKYIGSNFYRHFSNNLIAPCYANKSQSQEYCEGCEWSDYFFV